MREQWPRSAVCEEPALACHVREKVGRSQEEAVGFPPPLGIASMQLYRQRWDEWRRHFHDGNIAFGIVKEGFHACPCAKKHFFGLVSEHDVKDAVVQHGVLKVVHQA